MAVYSIRDLETLSGIKAHTIRIWEKRYNLIKPHRTATNIRYYTDNELKKILNVAVLNRHGIRISNIAKLNEEELKEEIMRVSEANPDLEHAIDSLIVAMIDLDEVKFNAIISKAISKKGLKAAMLDIVYPFLKRIGLMWQAGDINPVQEHFVSNLIRQKLITAIEGVSAVFRDDSHTFLLFLPEDEWHEIGLLFSQYIIRETGHRVIYLGQSVPYSDILATGTTHEIDHFLLASVVNRPQLNFPEYIKDLGNAFPDKNILYFCRTLENEYKKLPENTHHLSTILDLVSYVEGLEHDQK